MLSLIRTFLKDNVVEKWQRFLLCSVYGMKISQTARISSKAFLDRTNPKGIHIGNYTIVTGNVVVLTHNFVQGDKTYVDTFIGDNVFIGMNSVILPGVKVGNNVIIGAGSVVTKDVEDFSIVAGNPARILRTDKTIGKYGQFQKVETKA